MNDSSNKGEKKKEDKVVLIVQKMSIRNKDVYEHAYKYFSMISVLNNLELVKRDVQILAYAASQKKMVSDVKEEFVEKFGSSMATVGNIISKLYRKEVLLKGEKRSAIVNPSLDLDFEKDIYLNVKMVNKNNEDN